jgi:hypothetical protein
MEIRPVGNGYTATGELLRGNKLLHGGFHDKFRFQVLFQDHAFEVT